MKNLTPNCIIKVSNYSVIVMIVALIIRSILFLVFYLPIITNPEYAHGGFDVTVICYYGPMVIIDPILTIYFIYLLSAASKAQKNGILLEPAKKYFIITVFLFLTWVVFAIAPLIYMFNHFQ